MRLLLSGFEPFGGESVNPSAAVVARVVSQPPAGVEVTPLVLPVRGRVSFERLIPAFEAGGYDAWLGLGQAGEVVGVRGTEIALGGHVVADAVGNALRKIRCQHGGAGLVVAVVDALILRVGRELAGVVTDVVQQRGGDEGIFRLRRLRQEGSLQHVL